MLFACIINNILAIALPFLRIFPPLVIVITLFYAVALSFNVIYIQSIGSGIEGNSDLLLSISSNTYTIFTLSTGLIVSAKSKESQNTPKPWRLTKLEQSRFVLHEDLKNILVGLILGDLHIQKRTVNSNPVLKFEQGLVHKDYLFHLYDLFSSYCRSAPKITSRLPDKMTGKVYSRVTFGTFSLPCFNELFNLFYHEGKKIIPVNIENLLTPAGLAYWICDDGKYVDSGGLRLCTNSYTIQDVTRLMDVLITRFGLICTIHKPQTGQHVIYISKRSMDKLRSIVKPHMAPSMLYKIHL